MHQRKSKKLLIYFFLLIIISSTNNISLKNLEFQKVRNIEVSGLGEIENKLIIDQIKNLNLSNIFFINKAEINNLINSNPLIEKYEIFKSYPSAIKIIIKKLKNRNIGVLITDHNVRETLKIVDKVYIVNEGAIFFEGKPEEAVRNEKIKKFYLGSQFNY